MTVSSKVSDQTTKIIQVAARLFACQGYHGTSTREIARIAEISENTLFRHFEHKENLFWATLRTYLHEFELRRELRDGIAECAAPEIVLPLILAQFVDIAILKPELLRLIAIAFIELRWKAEKICYEYLSPIFSSVHGYLSGSIESGRLRAVDPSLVTAALATTVMMHPEFSKLIRDSHRPYSGSSEAIKMYSKFWLEVLSPPTSVGSSLPTSE